MCSDVFLFFEQKTISFLKILSGSYLCMKLLYFDFLVMFPPGFNLSSVWLCVLVSSKKQNDPILLLVHYLENLKFLNALSPRLNLC